MLRASPWSCVTKIVVTPSLRWISRISTCMAPRRLLSSAENGSSSKRTLGRITNARASATRCCWPPASSRGLRSPNPSSFTRAMASRTRRSISAAGTRRIRRPYAILRSTVMCGNSA
ncbi:hypothetical protein G6F58_013152 [Rhizopus delemar]|nr:hypothetical protein G6F58_013152 [Rhizopus delemar]